MASASGSADADEVLCDGEEENGVPPGLAPHTSPTPAGDRMCARCHKVLAGASLSPAQVRAVQITISTHGEGAGGSRHTDLDREPRIPDADLAAIVRGEPPDDPELAGVVDATRRILDGRGRLGKEDRADLAECGVGRHELLEIAAFVALTTISDLASRLADTGPDRRPR